MQKRRTYSDFLKHLGVNTGTNAPRPLREQNNFAKILDKYLADGVLKRIAAEDSLGAPDKRGYNVSVKKKKSPSPNLSKKIKFDARLDLHGMKALQAQSLVVSELKRLAGTGGRHLLIITGKGIHSPAGPVLKKSIKQLLANSKLIKEYRPAPPRLGGSGALIIKTI